MKHLGRYVIGMSLLISTPIITMQKNSQPTKRFTNSYCYNTYKELKNHKGKVGLAVGSIGTIVISKIFNKEINGYIKPLIKSLWNKTTGWIKRIFGK